MTHSRTLLHRLVPVLLALLVASGEARAQPEPPPDSGATAGERAAAVEWIRPEEVPARVDALRRQLEAAQPGTAAQATLAEIESGLERLGPDLDNVLDAASATLDRPVSFLRLDDLRRQLTDTAAPLDDWEDATEAEAKRVGRAFDDLAREQRVWSATRRRPGTAADPLVSRRVQAALDVSRSHGHVLTDPAPQGLFKGFGDSSLNFVLRAWTDSEYERTAVLTSELALAVHRGIVAAGITIPFPQRDLHLASVSPAVRDSLSALAPDGRGLAPDAGMKKKDR